MDHRGRDSRNAEAWDALTQPVAKFVARTDVGLVEVAVVNVEPLGIAVVARLNSRAVIGCGLCDGVGQLAGRGGGAVENVGEAVAGLLTGKAGPDYGLDIRLLENRLEDQGADGVDDYDRVLVGAGYGGDELVAVSEVSEVNTPKPGRDLPRVPGIEVVAVSCIPFDSDVALATVGRNEYNRSISFGSRRSRSPCIIGRGSDERSAVRSCMALNRIKRRNKVWELGGPAAPSHG